MGIPSYFTLFNFLLAFTYFGVICVQSLAIENNWSDVESQAAENEEFAKDILEAMSTLSPNQCRLFKDMTKITFLVSLSQTLAVFTMCIYIKLTEEHILNLIQAIKKDSGDLTTLCKF